LFKKNIPKMDLMNQYRKYFPQKKLSSPPKLSPRKTYPCKTYSSLFPGELDGEEDAKEECSDDDPKNNPNKTPRKGENEGESSNHHLHDAVLNIKTNPMVVSCLKKLFRLQLAQDIKRFSTRSDPAQNGCWRKSKNGAVHSDCCFARNNNNPPEENVKDVNIMSINSPGPFQCCPMPIKHSRSHDYDFVPKLRKSQTNNNCENKKLIYGPSFFNLQPQFGKAKIKPLS
jgi:hypothetical protein